MKSPSAIRSTVLLALALLSWPKPTHSADVCLMLYQLADNDLERYLRDDNFELTQSSAIREESLTTWIYFDGRNFLGTDEDIDEPLENVFMADGSPLTTKETGSRYLTWDKSLQKMVVERTLVGEQNGDDPRTVSDFMLTALADCVTQGSTEFMLIFSSHGAGPRGFGGDEHTGRRQLTQANQDIAGAIQVALSNTAGVPDKLHVLGFDACLMQSFGALDDYRSVTQYMLASEALEPGHGWAYSFLDTADSALAMAENFHTNFLKQPQGQQHDTPKTMSIVETDKYSLFLNSLELLSVEMATLLESDATFVTAVRRARGESLAFEGAFEFGSDTSPSGLDMGDYLLKLQSLCAPQGTVLATLLGNAMDSYNEMFVARGVGPGTSTAATGMMVLWPTRSKYMTSKEDYDVRLFDAEFIYATTAAPNFLAFLDGFYNLDSPTAQSGDSVCTIGTDSAVEPTFDGQLLLSPELTLTEFTSTVSSEVSSSADEVFVEYGIDLSTLAGRRLDLQEMKNRIQETSKQFPNYNRRHRRTQGIDEFIFYGGDVFGTFSGSFFNATWDDNFYAVSDDDESLGFVYVHDLGVQKTAAVMYFPQGIEQSQLPLGTTVEEAALLGGVAGFVYFSPDIVNSDGSITDVVLYTSGTASLSETPRSAGGAFSPIISTGFNGETFNFVGGFLQTVIPWTEDNTIAIIPQNAADVAGIFGATDVTLDMYAIDYEGSLPVEYVPFVLTYASGGGDGSVTATPTAAPSDSVTGSATATPTTARSDSGIDSASPPPPSTTPGGSVPTTSTTAASPDSGSLPPPTSLFGAIAAAALVFCFPALVG